MIEVPVWWWVLLAVLNASMARRRNRSALNWFAISLFTGPLATVLIRLWPRLPLAGSASWTRGQLVSGGVVALAGAVLWAGAALTVNGGIPLWSLCAGYLVGAGVFTWLYLSRRVA